MQQNQRNYAGANLTPAQGAGIARLAKTIHGSKAAAIRTAIDVGLRQLDPEYR